jgi:ferredoxin
MKCVEKCKRGSIVKIEGEKPEGVYDIKALMELKHKLGLFAKRKSTFIDECIGCLICVITCPLNAIGYRNENGIRIIEIDQNTCEGCGMCVMNCPNYALSLVEV